MLHRGRETSKLRKPVWVTKLKKSDHGIGLIQRSMHEKTELLDAGKCHEKKPWENTFKNMRDTNLTWYDRMRALTRKLTSNMALFKLDVSDSPEPMERQLCTAGRDDLTRTVALLRSAGLHTKMLSPENNVQCEGYQCTQHWKYYITT